MYVWRFLRATAATAVARVSHRNSVRPSVCLSACLSHEWISQKRCKLKSPSVSGTVLTVKPNSACTGTLFLNFQLQSCVKKRTTVKSVPSKRGLSTIPHCLEWNKPVLRARLTTLACNAVSVVNLAYSAHLLLSFIICVCAAFDKFNRHF